jgi:hypothetical protein
MVDAVTVQCQECGVEFAGDSPELRLELTYDVRGLSPAIWLLWVVAIFVASLQLGWWLFSHALAG